MRNFGSVIIIAVAAFAVAQLSAEPNGFTGRTSTSTQGCGTCHGSAPNVSTVLTFEGVRNVRPNSTNTFTVIVAHPTQPSAGVGIAVRTTPTGSSTAGTLSITPNTGLRMRGSEITHLSARPLTAGSVRFTFTWKAPNEPGTYYLQAIGNAVNGNGRDDAGDAWNWLQPVAIVVEDVTGVDELLPGGAFMVYPNPVAPGGTLTISVPHTGEYDVRVVGVSGTEVFTERFIANTSTIPLPLPNLPGGVYAIVVLCGTTERRGIVVVE